MSNHRLILFRTLFDRLQGVLDGVIRRAPLQPFRQSVANSLRHRRHLGTQRLTAPAQPPQIAGNFLDAQLPFGAPPGRLRERRFVVLPARFDGDSSDFPAGVLP